MSKDNSMKSINQCTARIQAMRKHVQGRVHIPVGGETLSGAGVIDVYQRVVNAYSTLAAKRAEVKAALAERKAAEAVRRKADRSLRNWVGNTFGEDSQEAHDFAFPPPKPRVISPETKTIAAAKARATRKARHTMGKRQKADIKGVIEQPIVLPTDHSNGAPAPASAAMAPAAAPPPNTNGAPAPTNGASVIRTGT